MTPILIADTEVCSSPSLFINYIYQLMRNLLQNHKINPKLIQKWVRVARFVAFCAMFFFIISLLPLFLLAMVMIYDIWLPLYYLPTFHMRNLGFEIEIENILFGNASFVNNKNSKLFMLVQKYINFKKKMSGKFIYWIYIRRQRHCI